MKTFAIIQARMGSTRLPGKVLKDVNGRPLLSYMIERVRRSKKLQGIVIATTILKEDDPISDFCQKNKIPFYRGESQDVLDRYYQCAKQYEIDVIVRLTADCPLIDPAVIDDVVGVFEKGAYNYVANTAPPVATFPDGMDLEVFSFKDLERAWKEAKAPSEREHVTFYFWKTNFFKTYRVDLKESLSHYRLTVDYPEDFKVVSTVLAALYPSNPEFSMNEIITYLKNKPELKAINSHIGWNKGWNPALEKDKK